jgi:hypothetical protein
MWSVFCDLRRLMTTMSQNKPEWRSGEDFRIVCDCQRHRGHDLWWNARRGLRRQLSTVRRHGVTLLVGVPLALGVFDLPTKHMQADDAAARQVIEASATGETMPVFTTPSIREQFLNPSLEPQKFSIDSAKEEFFRTQIPYGSIIYREARRNQLPPELVAAVVHTESDFRPRLVSNKQAHGLMQLIPETGRLMGANDLFDPDENVRAGARYLRYLMDRFGDQTIALAAYNAGEGNVERFGGIPPFPETINYVKRVDTRMARYRARVESTYVASMRTRRTIHLR